MNASNPVLPRDSRGTADSARNTVRGGYAEIARSGCVDRLVELQDPLRCKTIARLPPGTKPGDCITNMEISAQRA